MDMQDLELFVCFAEQGSLSAVAEQHVVSQPSVTRAMQRLEQELGVPLFHRTKNRIMLNENGQFAAAEAKLTLAQFAQMKSGVQALDRRRRTISIASCEVFCIAEIISQVCALYPDMTIASEIRTTAPLLNGLADGQYDLVILPSIPSPPDAYRARCVGEEHLQIVVPANHRLADRSTVSFAEINGENMLLYSEIGFWKDVVDAYMPDSRFLIQNERFLFQELILHSVMPFFSTVKAQRQTALPPDRVAIPLSDAAAHPSFYLVCKKEKAHRFRPLFAERA